MRSYRNLARSLVDNLDSSELAEIQQSEESNEIEVTAIPTKIAMHWDAMIVVAASPLKK